MKTYSDSIKKHFKNPKNTADLEKKESSIIATGLVGSPSCGDVLKLKIEIDKESGIILSTSQRTFGCGTAMASNSLLSELLIGKHIDEVDITDKQISDMLDLPPIKFHCSVLAESAIKSAREDYYKQKNN